MSHIIWVIFKSKVEQLGKVKSLDQPWSSFLSCFAIWTRDKIVSGLLWRQWIHKNEIVRKSKNRHHFLLLILFKNNWLHRCWWRMLETKCVGDGFGRFRQQHPLSPNISVGQKPKNCHQDLCSRPSGPVLLIANKWNQNDTLVWFQVQIRTKM